MGKRIIGEIIGTFRTMLDKEISRTMVPISGMIMLPTIKPIVTKIMNGTKHQYSDRQARPESVKYFENADLTASFNYERPSFRIIKKVKCKITDYIRIRTDVLSVDNIYLICKIVMEQIKNKERDMLGYVMVGTNNFDGAAEFYDKILAELGAKRTMGGDDFIVWGTDDTNTAFSITKPNDGNAATVGNGVMMAFAAPDHATVDKVHAMALEMGGTCEGAPGPRPEFDEKFYVGYFRDLDGNKMNVFNFPMP